MAGWQDTSPVTAPAVAEDGITPPGTPYTVRAPIGGAGADSLVSGIAVLTEGPAGVVIRIQITDLPVEARSAWHGLHLHLRADCSGDGFATAGSHVGAGENGHGLLAPDGPEAGDLPNVWADAAGDVNAEIHATAVTLTGALGRTMLLDDDGSTLILHAGPDDHTSTPAGDAGGRIACGEISPAEP